MRVEGRNEPGVAARITQRIAQAGLNLRGFSGAIIGTQFVLHLAFDSDEDSRRAVTLLQTPARSAAATGRPVGACIGRSGF
ncbi:MAG: hypothetical protein M5U12_09315 [Verrucomicrobia bacterium]|nr:hypothetical protein [Verrucomicrobiota bacterium]